MHHRPSPSKKLLSTRLNALLLSVLAFANDPAAGEYGQHPAVHRVTGLYAQVGDCLQGGNYGLTCIYTWTCVSSGEDGDMTMRGQESLGAWETIFTTTDVALFLSGLQKFATSVLLDKMDCLLVERVVQAGTGTTPLMLVYLLGSRHFLVPDTSMTDQVSALDAFGNLICG